MYWNKLVIIWLVLLPAIGIANQNLGSVSGGGGELLFKLGSRPVLLDIALHDGVTQDITGTQVEFLTENGVLRAFGFDRYRLEGTPSFQLAIERIRHCQYLPRIWRAYIEYSLRSKLDFFYVFHPLVKSRQYFLPRGSAALDSEIRTAILFDSYLLGPVIDAHLWNQTGELSRAGLLVHEALRSIQQILGDHFSNSQLQDLTATILLDQDLLSARYKSFLGSLAESFPAQRYLAHLDERPAPGFVEAFEDHVRLILFQSNTREAIDMLRADSRAQSIREGLSQLIAESGDWIHNESQQQGNLQWYLSGSPGFHERVQRLDHIAWDNDSIPEFTALAHACDSFDSSSGTFRYRWDERRLNDFPGKELFLRMVEVVASHGMKLSKDEISFYRSENPGAFDSFESLVTPDNVAATLRGQGTWPLSDINKAAVVYRSIATKYFHIGKFFADENRQTGDN